MNYFEFYNIPFSLNVDEKLLKQRFYENSMKHHPDFFTLDGIEKQMEALEVSTLNNKAYNTLKDFDRRLKYILEEKSVLKEEGSNNLPQEFLMEMMKVNEAVMDLQFDFDEEKHTNILEEVKTTKAELKSTIDKIIPKTEDQITSEDFEELRNYYLKSKYLIRLTDNMKAVKPS